MKPRRNTPRRISTRVVGRSVSRRRGRLRTGPTDATRSGYGLRCGWIRAASVIAPVAPGGDRSPWQKRRMYLCEVHSYEERNDCETQGCPLLDLGLNAVDPVRSGGWSGELSRASAMRPTWGASPKLRKTKPTMLMTTRHPGEDDHRESNLPPRSSRKATSFPDLLRPWRPGARRDRREPDQGDETGASTTAS